MDEKKAKKYSEVENCPIRNVIDRFGDKWSILILMLLSEGDVFRFSELHKIIGTISQKMLSVTLKSLEADGLVSRKVYPQIPPKVEYALTNRGESLMPHIESLTDWAMNNFKSIQESRKKFAQKNMSIL